MLKLCQPRKHLSYCEYFPANETKPTRYFYHYSSIAYYIHYFVFVMFLGHDSSAKYSVIEYDGLLPAGLTSDRDVHKSSK